MNKKTIYFIIGVTLFLSSCCSGCLFEDLFFGTSFTLKSWSIIDDEGFPALNISYSCSGMVTVKLFTANHSQVDSDFFFRGDGYTVLHIGEYRETTPSTVYVLKVYDKKNDEIFSKSFSFINPDVSISTCTQRWWVHGDVTMLIGLTIQVFNNGDHPVYPYSITMEVGSNQFSGLVLPSVVLPGESKTINCFIHLDGTPSVDSFKITLKDSNGFVLNSSFFSFEVKNSVSTRVFTEGVPSKLVVPYPDFLFNYYTSLKRFSGEEDYSVYVFDPYDDGYLDIFIDRLISTLPFGEYSFNAKNDAEKIDFVTKFVQFLEYREDDPLNLSKEYPNYPVETLFNHDIGCDCEDKAILTASLLDRLGFNVSLLRLPNHMAVGVKLNKSIVPGYKVYTGDYYFLETTTENAKVGFIPPMYRSPSELTVYEISSRPVIFHHWKNDVLTTYLNTEIGDIVKANVIVENYGRGTAKNIVVKGVFKTVSGSELNSEIVSIQSIKPGTKKKVSFYVETPDVTSKFETLVFYSGEVVDTKESSSYIS
ncbi:MAG: hypothetical protein DRM98_04820 [Thermoplasmata archaeon]|nr:MAG: hypothetical protein DRM98_04820 [Thermoplasmata archaeon]